MKKYFFISILLVIQLILSTQPLFPKEIAEIEEAIIGEWQVLNDTLIPPVTLTVSDDYTCEYNQRGDIYAGSWEITKDEYFTIALFIWEEKVVWWMYIDIFGVVMYLYPDLDTSNPYMFQKIN